MWRVDPPGSPCIGQCSQRLMTKKAENLRQKYLFSNMPYRGVYYIYKHKKISIWLYSSCTCGLKVVLKNTLSSFWDRKVFSFIPLALTITNPCRNLIFSAETLEGFSWNSRIIFSWNSCMICIWNCLRIQLKLLKDSAENVGRIQLVILLTFFLLQKQS